MPCMENNISDETITLRQYLTDYLIYLEHDSFKKLKNKKESQTLFESKETIEHCLGLYVGTEKRKLDDASTLLDS